MNILSKLESSWATFIGWMYSPMTMMERARKSPVVFALMLFFLIQPVISLYINTAQDIGWIKHKVDPVVINNQNRIDDLEKRVDKLEHK